MAPESPSPAGRLSEWATAAYYTVCMLVLLAMLWPGLRQTVWHWLRLQMYLWEVGQWEQHWSDLPAWKQEALEVRGRRVMRRTAA